MAKTVTKSARSPTLGPTRSPKFKAEATKAKAKATAKKAKKKK
ncbi:hypothetical protein [Modestobacter marinus]|nr:hypothetical protein [Modestobacter marinus]NIH68243.1 hypothetical protein [Modestobacter marinus]